MLLLFRFRRQFRNSQINSQPRPLNGRVCDAMNQVRRMVKGRHNTLGKGISGAKRNSLQKNDMDN